MGISSDKRTETLFRNLDTVIDTDFHLTESPKDFVPYINEPFHSMIHKSNQKNDPGYMGTFYPTSGHINTSIVSGRIEYRSVSSKEDIIEAKEAMDLDRVIVDPTRNLYLSGVNHDELAVALANAYNSWVLDKIVDPSEGIYAPILIAPQKPEDAVKEILNRKDEKGFVGVFVPSGGLHPLIGNERYDPIYEACDNANLPVLFHNASGTLMLSFPLHYHDMNRHLPIHATLHSMTYMTHIADMITRGIPEKYPDLDFVFQEAGIGWLPYLARRLDHEYSEKRSDAPMLTKMPSEYIRDQFYFTSQPVEGSKDPEYINSMVNLMGTDNLMFSSDYPHFDYDHPSELITVLKKRFDDDAIRKIYGETALGVYNF